MIYLSCIDVTCADSALTYSIHMLTDYLPCEARDYRDVDGTQTHSSNIRERQLKQQTDTIHMLRLLYFHNNNDRAICNSVKVLSTISRYFYK